MNKIFKVVWSKSKECYVVVSEVAKNNGGKKKVLASVLAGLAMVGMGATVQAADMNTDTSANTKNQINIWANTTNKENPATPGASTGSGSGVQNANDVTPSTYGDEIGIAIGSQNKIKPGITTNAGGGSSIAMGIKNEVRGNRNVAIGTNSKTYGENSIALGTKVEAGTGHGIAIGSDDNGTATVAYGGTTPDATGSNVGNAFALAIGSGAQADGRANGASGGIAIGQLVKSTNNNTVAIGVSTTASGNNAVAIGSGAQATQRISTAYGPNANANSAGGVAIGTDAAVGTDTGLTTVIAGATAVGANAQAQSTNGSAFGRNAKADKNAENATALGAYATANIAGGVALGSESKTTKDAGEIGYNPATGRTNDYKALTNNTKAALTSTRAAVSIGDDSASVTRQLTGLAAGTQDTDAVNVAQLKAVNLKYAGDTGNSDVLLKDGTLNVKGSDYITTSADGTGITVKAKIGDPITANNDGKAVAPTTNGLTTTTNVTDAINASGWKVTSLNNGGTTNGTTSEKVSPGDTVTFSAGKNIVLDQAGKQFTYSLSSTLKGIESIQNGASKITLNNGGGTTISGGNLSVDGNKITKVAEGENNTDAVNVKQLKANRTEVKAGDNIVVTSDRDATDNHTVYTVNAVTPAVYTTPDGEKLTKDKDGKFHKVGETAEYTGDIITSFENPKAAAGQTTKDGGMIVNNIGSAIKNQTPTMPAGQTATYLDKLKAAADSGSNVKNAAVNVSDLHNTAEALKSNELHIRPTTSGRTGETVNQDTAGTAESYKYDAATKSVTLKYNDGTGAGVTGTEAKIDLSDLANQITSGYTFKTNATENGGKVVNDAATPAAETAVANGGVVNYAAGKNLTVKQDIEKDGTGAATGKQTYTYALADEIGIGEKGQPGVAGKDGVDGKIGVNGKDGSSVVINGKDGSIGMTGPKGQNGKDGINGRDGADISMTSAKGEQVLVNRDPAHNTDTDKAERIVYVPKDANGNPIQGADGKNIVREVATMDDGLKFTGNNESTENKQKLGSLVKVQGEGTKESTAVDPVTGKKYVVLSDGTTKFESAKDNIAVEADGTDTLTVKLNKDLKGLNSIQLGGNTIQSNGDNITFTTNGGTTKTVATTDQLWTIQANGIDVPATNGKVNVVGKDGITVAKNAAGNLEISGTGLGTMNGFDVTANNGATTKTIKDGNKVDFNATSNLTVKQTSDANGTHIEYSLNKDVDLGNTGSLKTGDTTINNDGFKNGNTTVGGNGMTINNPTDPTKTVSLTKDGLNNGGNQIKNVAPGTDGTDAVNVDQLNQAVATAASTEKVIRKNDTNNLAKVDTQSTHAAGDKGETYIVSVDKDDVKDAAREAVEVTGSGVIKVTADSTTTPHKTTYDVAYDPDKAADVTKISYKSSTSTDAGSQAPKKTTLADGLDFTSDDNSVAITTGANGKVNFKVDTTGIQGKAFNLDVNKEGTGKVENAQTAAATPSVEKGTKFVAGNNLSIRHDAINGDANYDHQVTYALNSDLKGINSITNNGGATMNFGPNEVSITGGNLNMGGSKITNVKNGTDKSDVATVGQLTKVTSNDNTVAINKTTDADGAPVYDLSVQGGGHDPRVDQLGEEIGRVGAQGAALAALKPIQYDPLEPTQIMAGYGNYRGNSAIAMGVAHYKNESTLMHAGVSWAGGSRHMMANAGVTWKVGNRDSEAAVADRYRKGPISSAYAMQQEMASVKAQNAGLKTEVSDLKAENEQMKAQIAAMMAKLGM